MHNTSVTAAFIISSGYLNFIIKKYYV